MRLGRAPHDAARLAAAPQIGPHKLATLAPPPRLIRDHVPFQPGLYGNDMLPDCTAVGLANAARAFGALNGAEPVVNPESVPAFYAACVECAPTPDAMAATDGAVLLDVLARQGRTGFDVGEQVPLVADFAVCDPANRAQLASVMARLGAGYWGVDLALADQASVGGVWDIATAGDQTPGSWGGHCLIGWSYTGLSDTDMVMLGTWGRWQRATWRWVQSRLTEAYAPAWRQLMPADGLDWAGLDWDRLHADAAAWAG